MAVGQGKVGPDEQVLYSTRAAFLLSAQPRARCTLGSLAQVYFSPLSQGSWLSSYPAGRERRLTEADHFGWVPSYTVFSSKALANWKISYQQEMASVILKNVLCFCKMTTAWLPDNGDLLHLYEAFAALLSSCLLTSVSQMAPPAMDS